MGFTKTYLRLLLDEAKQRPFNGSLLQLGKLDICFTEEVFKKYAKLHHFRLHGANKIQISNRLGLKEENYLDDVSFFKSFGFNIVHSIDYSGFEGADIIFDLNKPIPKYLYGKYDVIIDGGTLEHIFNLPVVLENIHNLLKLNGRFICITPSASFDSIDHGFYMFSPTLFKDYYTANCYDIDKIYVSNFNMHTVYEKPHYFYNYMNIPSHVLQRFFNGSNKNSAEIFFVVTKKKNSTSNVIPQQDSYIKMWSNQTNKKGNKKNKINEVFNLSKNRFKKNTLLRNLARAWPIFDFRVMINHHKLKKTIKPVFKY